MNNKIIIEKEEFSELIEALNSLKIIEFFKRNDDMIVSFNTNKLIGIIHEIGIDIVISKKEFDKVDSKEAKGLLFLLNKSRISGVSNIKIGIEEIVCKLFFIENFYNFFSPIIDGDSISISLDKELKIILDSLDEIQRVTKEKYTLDFLINDKDNIVELELAEPYIEILNEIRLNK